MEVFWVKILKLSSIWWSINGLDVKKPQNRKQIEPQFENISLLFMPGRTEAKVRGDNTASPWWLNNTLNICDKE